MFHGKFYQLGIIIAHFGKIRNRGQNKKSKYAAKCLKNKSHYDNIFLESIIQKRKIRKGMCKVVKKYIIPESQKGITLVTLVITMVILIILSVVTINMTLGENGFIQRSKETSDNSANTVAMEEEDMNKVTEEYVNAMEQHEEISLPNVIN